MQKWSNDAWKKRWMAVQKGRAKNQGPPPPFISLTDKMRLRLRSASLTAIRHSSSFPFPLTCFPLCCSGTSSVSRRTGWGRREVGLSLQAGGEYWTCEWGTLSKDNPWGCSVQGPFYSPSVCLGMKRGSVSCIINEGGWRPIQQCPAAICICVYVYIHTMVMTRVKPGFTLLWQSMLYNQPWRIEQLGEMERSANFWLAHGGLHCEVYE